MRFGALLLLHRTAAAIACRVVWRAHAISGWWLATALSQGLWRCFISAKFEPCGTRVVSVLSIESLLSVRIDRISCLRHRFLRCLEQLDLSHFREEKRLSVIDFSMNSISFPLSKLSNATSEAGDPPRAVSDPAYVRRPFFAWPGEGGSVLPWFRASRFLQVQPCLVLGTFTICRPSRSVCTQHPYLLSAFLW